MTDSKPRTLEHLAAEERFVSAPVDFDLAEYPIIAQHFFGIDPRRQTSDVENMAARHKRQCCIEHLHSLGARAVGELLDEVAQGKDLDRALEAYQRLTPELLAATGGNRFPPFPIYEVQQS